MVEPAILSYTLKFNIYINATFPRSKFTKSSKPTKTIDAFYNTELFKEYSYRRDYIMVQLKKGIQYPHTASKLKGKVLNMESNKLLTFIFESCGQGATNSISVPSS